MLTNTDDQSEEEEAREVTLSSMYESRKNSTAFRSMLRYLPAAWARKGFPGLPTAVPKCHCSGNEQTIKSGWGDSSEQYSYSKVNVINEHDCDDMPLVTERKSNQDEVIAVNTGCSQVNVTNGQRDAMPLFWWPTIKLGWGNSSEHKWISWMNAVIMRHWWPRDNQIRMRW